MFYHAKVALEFLESWGVSNVPGHSLKNGIYKHFMSLNFSASSYVFFYVI